jgi:hypothetical protein
MCLMLKLLDLLLNFYLLGVVTFFSLKFSISSLQTFLLSHFFLNLQYFFHFFPNKNCQVKKFWGQKNMLVGGERNYLHQKFHQFFFKT